MTGDFDPNDPGPCPHGDGFNLPEDQLLDFDVRPEASGFPSLRAAIIGFVVVLFLAFLLFAPDRVIYPKSFQDPSEVLVVPQKVTLPPVEVTLPEVFQILGEYDIVHVSKLMTILRYYGLTVPDSRTIFINSDTASESQTETAIHEVVHIIYSRRGYDTRGPYEDLVEQKAQEVYAQLYGPSHQPPQTGDSK